ncbi:hypothetical protein [Clostridium kluyveri]|uniref:hypothetical protein n=1 Tax=Clostridium kluyveri TaxID=1534 RepID=UPI002247A666|nr:hypothetical protein [Clostridium kluyveri]UZQ49447.1 hypothetical protein OP486_16025 [Clostridium kluyveri]
MGDRIINTGNGNIINGGKQNKIISNINYDLDSKLLEKLDEFYNEYKEYYPKDKENILLIDNAKKSILSKNKIDIRKYLTPLLNLTKDLSVNILSELINKKLLML